MHQKNWIKDVGFRQMCDEHEYLLPAQEVFSITEEFIHNSCRGSDILQSFNEIDQHLYSLSDLQIATVANEDTELVSVAADLFFANQEAEADTWSQNRANFTQSMISILSGEGYDSTKNIEKPTFSTSYLLLLGAKGSLGESLDLNSVSSVVCSGRLRYRDIIESKSEELIQLGFSIEVSPAKESVRIVISLSEAKANLWHYFLNWWMDQIVVLGKPLDYFNSTFYLPLDLLLKEDIEQKKEHSVGDYIAKKLIKNVNAYKYKAETAVGPEDLEKLSEEEQRKTFEKNKEINSEDEAWIYFLPHQRRYLFDELNAKKKYGDERIQPIREFRLVDEHAPQADYMWEVRVADDEHIKLPIKQVTLYTYFNGMMYLSIQVEKKIDISGDWGISIVTGDEATREAIKDNQYSRYLKFTKNARVLYPSFIDAEKEGKHYVKSLYHKGLLLAQDDQEELTTLVANDKRFKASVLLSKPVMYLLAQFFKATSESKQGVPESIEELIDMRLTNLPDDRMFVSTCYGVVGELPDEDLSCQRMFSYALNVDDDSMIFSSLDDFCYDKSFVLGQLDEQVYKRWLTVGTWSGFTDFSHAYLGRDWFFKNHIAERHVPTIYNRMLLSALFYRLSFEHYNRRITKQTNRLVHKSWYQRLWGFWHPPFTKLRRDFILFVNQYWFTDLTNQVQGREQFRMMLAPLAIEDHFEQIKSELHAADEYVSNMNAKSWALVAVFFSVISIIGLLEVAPQISCICQWLKMKLGLGVDLETMVANCSKICPYLDISSLVKE